MPCAIVQKFSLKGVKIREDNRCRRHSNRAYDSFEHMHGKHGAIYQTVESMK